MAATDPGARDVWGDATRPVGTVELFWIPLGAGTNVVRISGKGFEWLSAAVQRRSRCDLYHSALRLQTNDGPVTIEQAPVVDGEGAARRGVVAEGPVGLRCLGRFRIFRYEVRCWSGGVIPDLAAAVGSPVSLTADVDIAERIVRLLPTIPTPVWGRDEFDTGEMWNSNSVVSWVLTRSGIDAAAIAPPPGGRAPGWHAGLVVAERLRRAA